MIQHRWPACIARTSVLCLALLCARVWAISIDNVAIVAPSNSSAVTQYSKLELLVTLSGVSATNNYCPEATHGGVNLTASFTGPGPTVWPINGYFDGSSWRIRFSPTVTGAWTFSVSVQDPGGSASFSGGSFTCVASNRHGFVQINGTKFNFSDGSVFFGVGHNNGWQYAGAGIEQPSLSAMAAQGENLLSFWLATPWAKPSYTSTDEPWWNYRSALENVESGITNYHQPACAYMDDVVARAEAAGVYLLPTIWAHDQLCNDASGVPGQGTGPSGWPASWVNNAYQSVCDVKDFYQTTDGLGNDTNQWRIQKYQYRYILARWGYSPAIAGWVAVDEIDGTTGNAINPGNTNTWCAAMKTYFASVDAYRTNGSGQYPLGVSKTIIDGIAKGQSSNATFTWPMPFDGKASIARIMYKVLWASS